MRMTRSRLATVMMVLALVAASMSASACGGKNINTIVKTTADYGTTLVKGVKATAEAVSAAEAKGAIQRNDAVKVMETLQLITTKADEASIKMDLLIKAQGTPQAPVIASQLDQILVFIDSELFKALVPIKDEALKQQIGALAAEVSRTLLLINRELLGRIQ